MIAYVNLILAIVGLVAYMMASNPKAIEIARIVFLAAMIATCFALNGHTFKVL